MPRLNISIPDEVYELAQRMRGEVNLSAVCAAALRDELLARANHRRPPALLREMHWPSELEDALQSRFGLRAALVCTSSSDAFATRDELGRVAAGYLERELTDGSAVAISGGRQMWCMVSQLRPRRSSYVLTAMGFGNHDAEVLHAHANTLVTLMWLLYAPHSKAHLVGSPEFAAIWQARTSAPSPARRFVLTSCGPFDSSSSFATILGENASASLERAGVSGDVAYTFFDAEGRRVVINTEAPSSLITLERLQELSLMEDTHVVVIAGGKSKARFVRLALENRLCNVLITDSEIAHQLTMQE
jgi:DNA-binding transcriptional regulator LsrR (DeoR family)